VTLNDFDDARIVTLMQAYLDADYRWELDRRWQSLRIGTLAPVPEAAFPDGSEFGLLSAWDPYSVVRPEPANRIDDDALHAALLASGRPHRPAFSSAPNRSWREPSWLVVDLPAAELDALAQRFGQLATLYWRRGEPVRLRMYRPQPSTVAPAWTDWLPLPERRGA
jgi:hypothetical protein